MSRIEWKKKLWCCLAMSLLWGCYSSSDKDEPERDAADVAAEPPEDYVCDPIPADFWAERSLCQVLFVDPTESEILHRGCDRDANPANGLQYDVTFISDVAEGSPTRLQVNGVDMGSESYVSCGVTYWNVTLPEGENISIRGCAVDSRGECCTDIEVTVDLSP
jgi:hypothetical protein